jgi:CHASE1-domain containing sensor protein
MMSTQEICSASSVSRCRQYAPTALLVVLGAAISVAVFFAAYSWERRSTGHEFDSLAEDRFHAIANVIDDSARLLQFADNVFLVGPRADSPEFLNYIRSLTAIFKVDLSRHPAVRAVTWMPRVPLAERAAYERAARTIFDPAFQFGEPVASVNTGSGQQREEYFPSYLCIATTPHHDQPGKDLARDRAEWKVMERARDTGLIVASAPVRMAADPDDPLGYRLFQPLYRGDPADIASRRQSIAGFLCVDLDIGQSVAKAFKDIPPTGIDVWVSDDTDGKRVAICRHTSRLQSPATVGVGQGALDELESTETMEFFGRRLLLRCCSTPAFWAGRTIWQPWVLLCGGLVLTLTVAGYRLSLAFRASAIERAVESRMAALCQDIEQQQKAKRSPKQMSPPAELVNDKLYASVIGAPVNTSDLSMPTACRRE